jgi:hypothetical protein
MCTYKRNIYSENCGTHLIILDIFFEGYWRKPAVKSSNNMRMSLTSILFVKKLKFECKWDQLSVYRAVSF